MELFDRNIGDINDSRRPLLRTHQLADIKEEDQNDDSWSLFFKFFGFCRDTLCKWREESIVSKLSLPTVLPTEILLVVADSLNAVDILRLSCTCKPLRQIFDDPYWISYLAKKPQVCSSLTLFKSLSPSVQRKAFFSHLLYVENQISLAARLGHPEAAILEEYAQDGVYIRNNQYYCPSGVIKYSSGQIDKESTRLLNEAIQLKWLRRKEIMRNSMRSSERFERHSIRRMW